MYRREINTLEKCVKLVIKKNYIINDVKTLIESVSLNGYGTN